MISATGQNTLCKYPEKNDDKTINYMHALKKIHFNTLVLNCLNYTWTHRNERKTKFPQSPSQSQLCKSPSIPTLATYFSQRYTSLL